MLESPLALVPFTGMGAPSPRMLTGEGKSFESDEVAAVAVGSQLSPDEQMVYAGSEGGLVHIWDTRRCQARFGSMSQDEASLMPHLTYRRVFSFWHEVLASYSSRQILISCCYFAYTMFGYVRIAGVQHEVLHTINIAELLGQLPALAAEVDVQPSAVHSLRFKVRPSRGCDSAPTNDTRLD
eukprot:2737301-Pyramimonas_sp.AAC.3